MWGSLRRLLSSASSGSRQARHQTYTIPHAAQQARPDHEGQLRQRPGLAVNQWCRDRTVVVFAACRIPVVHIVSVAPEGLQSVRTVWAEVRVVQSMRAHCECNGRSRLDASRCGEDASLLADPGPHQHRAVRQQRQCRQAASALGQGHFVGRAAAAAQRHHGAARHAEAERHSLPIQGETTRPSSNVDACRQSQHPCRLCG